MACIEASAAKYDKWLTFPNKQIKLKSCSFSTPGTPGSSKNPRNPIKMHNFANWQFGHSALCHTKGAQRQKNFLPAKLQSYKAETCWQHPSGLAGHVGTNRTQISAIEQKILWKIVVFGLHIGHKRQIWLMANFFKYTHLAQVLVFSCSRGAKESKKPKKPN